MQMKQAGYEATLRDGIDDKILHFDFKQPSQEEIAQAQQQEAMAQQQQQGQQVQKGDDIFDDPNMMFKRTNFDSSRGSKPSTDAVATTTGTDLPPLRTQSKNTRNSGGKAQL